MRWSGQTESDLRWEIVGRLAADSEEMLRALRATEKLISPN